MGRGRGISLGILLVLGTLLGCEGERTGTEHSTAEPASVSEAARIDEASVREHLAHLTGEEPVSIAGREVAISERGSERGRRAAAEYMKASFEKLGLPARILEFRAGDLRGYNVEATLRGEEDERHLWVTAHLDSAHNAGANDDASGLTSILLTAEALKELDPEHTVHFVAFDLEEVGLFGSYDYVEETVRAVEKREGEKAIIGALQSDMIAYERDGFDAVLGTCDQAGPIDDAFSRAAEETDSPIELREVCLGRSDHQPFWDAGFRAAVLTDGAVYDGYPCYHKPCDTLEELNLSYLRAMIQLTASATAVLAEGRGTEKAPGDRGPS